MGSLNGPVTVLERWRIAKVRKGAVWAVHVYAYCPREDAGWVTGPVTKWDDKTATVTTKTGERFRLEGEPGTSRDADLAWTRFLTRNRVKEDGVIDISTRYCRKGRAA